MLSPENLHDYEVFDNASLCGKLSYVNGGGGNSSSFSIDGGSYEYNAVLIGRGKVLNVMFQQFANEGDSVIKYKNADTLILIKNGYKYYYGCGGHHNKKWF